jgi:hypothetical protein
MYNPVILNFVVDEQNRRIREQHRIAQSLNSVERKPSNRFGWIRSMFGGFSRKQSEHTTTGEFSSSIKAQC